jgi:hypothetical protein
VRVLKKLSTLLLAILIIVLLFSASFTGSYFLFADKSTHFDESYLTMFSDNSTHYYLQKAAADLVVYLDISQPVNNANDLFELVDDMGAIMSPIIKRAGENQFKILPPEKGYLAGKRYTITLRENCRFSGQELSNAKILVFAIEKKSVERYEFTDKVKQISTEAIDMKTNQTVELSGTDFSIGDIVIGKDSQDKQVAYKINQLTGSGGKTNATVELPSLDEVIKDIEVYGEYGIPFDDIVLNPDISAQIVKNFQESDFFNRLQVAAYAAEEPKESPIEVSLTNKGDHIILKIKVTLKAGKSGIFGLKALTGHQVEITFPITIYLRTIANIDGLKNIDISQRIHVKYGFELTITPQTEEAKTAVKTITKNTKLSDLVDWQAYKKNIVDQLSRLKNDDATYEITLFKWKQPLPFVPFIIFEPEVKLFLDFNIGCELNFGKEFSTIVNTGVTFQNNKFASYYCFDRDPDELGWTLSVSGKVEAKAGLKAIVQFSIIDERIAHIGFDPQMGIYVDMFATLPIKTPDDLKGVNALYLYFEAGVYASVNFEAQLFMLKYEQEIAEKKLPLLQAGSNKISIELASASQTVKVREGKVVLPEMMFKYYDVVKATYINEIVAKDKLKYSVQNGSGLVINNGEILTAGASPNKSAFITATYKNDEAGGDSKIFSAIFEVLLGGSMLEGQVSAFTNNTSTSPIPGATVVVYADAQMKKPLNTTKSNEAGKFNFSIDAGEYWLAISADGYHMLTSYQKIEKDEIKFTEHILMINSKQIGSGTAGGTINNAIDGRNLSGVKIQLRENWNNRTGDYIAGPSIQTGSDGKYLITDVPVGYYTVEAQKDGFFTDYCNIIIQSSSPKMDHNFNISPILPEDQIRVVLRWGQYPSDLDSHLTGQSPNGTKFNVYYSSKRYSYANVELANLDVDDTSSYGPETITILKPINGRLVYAVHDYSNRGSSNSEKLSYSGAVVNVFKGGRQVASYNVPTGQIGVYWIVFELVDGQIQPINSLTNTK